jgi:hypothetical protein
MSSLAELPELVGFFSYSRRDDQHSDGALSRLRLRIHAELRLQLGRDFRLWQDTAAIPEGALWEDEIKRAIAESAFFIPIVTPSAVASPHCRFEFKAFLEREASIGRSNLVFPLLYVRVPALEHEAEWRRDDVLRIIGSRQYMDWQSFRHRDLREPEVALKIEHFCRNIVEALRRPAPPVRPAAGVQPHQAAEPERAATVERQQSERLIPLDEEGLYPKLGKPVREKSDVRRGPSTREKKPEALPTSQWARARDNGADETYTGPTTDILADGRALFLVGAALLTNGALLVVLIVQATFISGVLRFFKSDSSLILVIGVACAVVGLMTMRGAGRMKWVTFAVLLGAVIVSSLGVITAGDRAYLTSLWIAFGTSSALGALVVLRGWAPLDKPLIVDGLSAAKFALLFTLFVVPALIPGAVLILTSPSMSWEQFLILRGSLLVICACFSLVISKKWTSSKAPR